ncbi:MAG: AAA family ATPase [Prevotella sp.]|nr:AAA family ATPase [Prevotella sp.]
MAEINNTPYATELLQATMQKCIGMRHQFVMPEHMLSALLDDSVFLSVIDYFVDIIVLGDELEKCLKTFERVPQEADYAPEPSAQMEELVNAAYSMVIFSSAGSLDVPHLVRALLQMEDSWACFTLKKHLGSDQEEFMVDLIEAYEDCAEIDAQEAENEDDNEEDDETDERPDPRQWRRLVTCVNDTLSTHNPLIGREDELKRTIQVLCRKEKNNPLHVGEPGVGKTALVYGLTAMIVKGDVPKRLRGCKVYQMDLGSMLAGTQFRGDFEKRIKQVMDGIQREGRAIVYIDEIHNMVGAGRTAEGSMDASNMLKPYLEAGDIRFIGSTTYDEYNRYFSKSRGIVRRFQQIDITEPSIDEAIVILKGLQKKYADFHHVKYRPDAIEYAVRASAKYVNERFLPDKAIDLIDEAGAYCEMNGKDVVDKKLIGEILQRVCKVDAVALKDDSNAQLKTLRKRILSRVYGQDEAVRQVVEAVQMAKAGLTDDNKPMASLLFVGPTGVGKTEVARVLAQELGIQLVRFDMSEYTEKHTVAKLIGSPAGYVGYEDGGLLTDAIRKTPNCVLLLDEIEKAHSDIYNILLQVMDYASLTDNKGRKADFRNVVVIMTSNAGAQYAGQNVGFGARTSRGEAMLKQVKKTFKPEFINRLTGTVVFHDMDMTMAGLILDKKLRELHEKLQQRKVTMQLTDEARQYLLSEGFTREYGAREMDRVIGNRLKPLLMREILFGKLKKGGNAVVGIKDGQLTIQL